MFRIMLASGLGNNAPSSIAWLLVPIVPLLSLALVGGCDVPASSTNSSVGIGTSESSALKNKEGLTTPTILGASPKHLAKGKFVSATLKLKQEHVGVRESVELSVELDISPMWEIHILEAEHEETATQLELFLPDGIQAIGKWVTPEPDRSSSADGHEVYADKAVFTRVIEITENATKGKNLIRCEIKYQACNERQCMKPSMLYLGVPLQVD